MEILELLRTIYRLRGDTFSGAEVLGAINRAADEIERLREQTNNAIGKRYDAEAEVERLQALTEQYDKLDLERIAEIERLHDLLRGVGANRYWEGRWKNAEAEIKRLQELLRGTDANRYWEGRWRDAQAEVERMRKDKHAYARSYENDISALEVERLQVALACAVADKLAQSTGDSHDGTRTDR